MRNKIFLTAFIVFSLFFSGACYKNRLHTLETALTAQNKEIVSLKENLVATVLELINLQLDFGNYKKRVEAGAFDPNDLMLASVRLEGYVIEAEPLAGCTAAPIDRIENKQAFATSAHCVSIYNPAFNKVLPLPFKYRIVVERSDMSLEFYPVDGIKFFGDVNDFSDDVAMFEVSFEKEIPIFKLASRDPKPGERISMVSWHLGAGDQYYRGNVTRSVIGEGEMINNKVFLLKFVGINKYFHGASGAAIVSDEDGSILGVLGGSFTHPEAEEVIPVAVKASVLQEKYKNYKTSEKEMGELIKQLEEK